MRKSQFASAKKSMMLPVAAAILSAMAVSKQSLAAFSLVESFESLTPGEINGQNGWTGVVRGAPDPNLPIVGYQEVQADPSGAPNQVLAIAGSQSGFYDHVAYKSVTVANNTTGTLFFRFREGGISAGTNITINHGMTDQATINPATTDFNVFKAQHRYARSPGGPYQHTVRDNAAFLEVQPTSINTWYNFWMVINNTTDTWQGYIQGGAYTTQTLLASGSTTTFGFRNGAASGDLKNIIWQAGFSNEYADEIHLDTAGANLVNPLSSQWGNAAGSSWNNAGNWTNNTIPNGITRQADLGSLLSSSGNVTLNSPVTLNVLNFNNSAASYNVNGISTLTLDGPDNVVRAFAGSHTVSAPVVLNRNVELSALVGSTVTFTNDFSSPNAAAVTIRKSDVGVVGIKNARVGTLSVEAGTLRVNSGAGNAGTSKINALSIAGTSALPTATLDLTDHTLVIDYIAGASPAGATRNRLKSGYATGAWTGLGITSSSAAAAAGGADKTALGYGEASDLGLTGTLAGQTIDGDSLLIRYTYSGDADLDGKVNTLDFNLLAAAFGTAGNWINGDFNYSDNVDSTDFGALVANYGKGPIPGPLLGSVVPEPASLGVIFAAGSISLLRRRQSAKR